MKLNLKAVSIAEALLDTPFDLFNFSDEETIITLMYAMHVSGRTSKLMTFEDFQKIADSPDIAENTRVALSYVAQFNRTPLTSNEDTDEVKKTEPKRMSEMASYLIVSGGIDASYVMYDMELAEVKDLIDGIESQKKEKMEEQRFWTFYQILPHIGSSKLSSPTDIVTFEWEMEQKRQDMLKEIEENKKRLEIFLKSKPNVQ